MSKPKVSLLTKDEIQSHLPYKSVEETKEIPDGVGIYFVFHEDECLYVGKSKNFRSRWTNHHKLQELLAYSPIPLIYFLSFPHEPANLSRLETSYINSLNPVLNDPKRSITQKEESNRFQITVPELYHYRLCAWAYLKGTNRATLSSFLVQEEIEAGWETIDKNLDALAKLRGVTRDELNI